MIQKPNCTFKRLTEYLLIEQMGGCGDGGFSNSSGSGDIIVNKTNNATQLSEWKEVKLCDMSFLNVKYQ